MLCAVLLVGAAFLASDRRSEARAYGITVSELDSGGDLFQAARAAPLSVPALPVHGLAIDGAPVGAPAALQGALGTVLFERHPGPGPDVTILFGRERVHVPPGARVTIEGVAAAAETAPTAPLPTLVLSGTARKLVVEPAGGVRYALPTAGPDGLPVESLRLDGAPVLGNVSLVDHWDEIRIVTLAAAGPLDPVLSGPATQVENTTLNTTAVTHDPESPFPIDVPPVILLCDAYASVTAGHQNGTLWLRVDAFIEAYILPDPGQGCERANLLSFVPGIGQGHRVDGGGVGGGDPPPNDSPTADFTWTPAEPRVGTDVTFTGTGSDSTPPGGPLSFDWLFCDGAQMQGAEVVWSAAVPAGPCPVRLTVTDAFGATGTRTRDVPIDPGLPSLLVRAAPNPTDTTRLTAFNATNGPGGTPVDVTWSFPDGSEQFGSSVQYQFAVKGQITVPAAAPDGRSGSVLVTVRELPPVAAFERTSGEPVTGSPVTFEDRSFDPDTPPGTEPGIAQRTWSMPGFTARTGPTASYVFARPGTFTLTLTVRDLAGQEASTQAPVTVANRAPLVNATADPTAANIGDDVLLSATFWDPDGPAGAKTQPADGFTWREGAAELGTGASLTHAFTTGGVHHVVVEASDVDGATARGHLNVSVNIPPEAAFEAAPGTTFPTGTTLRLRDLSTDADGVIASREWLWGDGVRSTAAEHLRTFNRPGSRSVTLTVADDAGATDSLLIPIVVQNRPPDVAFIEAPTAGNEGEMLRFQAGATDPDGNVTAFAWSVDGAPAGTGRFLNRTFVGGVHTVRVEASDDAGATDAESVAVSINTVPRVVVVASPPSALAQKPIRFTATVTDADGDALGPVEWSFGDGATATGDSVVHAFEIARTYRVWANVTDSDGALGSASVLVAIQPAPFHVVVEHDPDLPVAGAPVEFRARLAVGHALVAARWQFDDGTPLVETTSDTVSHTFARSGSYTVTVQATSHRGGTIGGSRVVTVLSPDPAFITLTLMLPDGQPLDAASPALGYSVEVPRAIGPVADTAEDPSNITLPGGAVVTARIPPLVWAAGDRATFKIHMGTTVAHLHVTLQPDADVHASMQLAVVPTYIDDFRVLRQEGDAEDRWSDAGDRAFGQPLGVVRARFDLYWWDGTPARGQTVPLRVVYENPARTDIGGLGSRIVRNIHLFGVRTNATDGGALFVVPSPLVTDLPAADPEESWDEEVLGPGGPDIPFPDIPIFVPDPAHSLAYVPGRYTLRAGPTPVQGATSAEVRFFMDVDTVLSGAGFT